MLTAPGGLTYGYDPNGNQTSRSGDSFYYDHENRLTKIILSGGPDLNPCYDFTGDTFVDITDISQIAGRFGAIPGNPQYDAFYDLNSDGAIDITDIAAVAGQFGKSCPSRFTYNGDGLRVARGGSWLSSKYVWDVASGLPVILKETDSHNAANGQGTDNTYVYGLGLISVTDRSGNQTYYTSDGLGSTTDLTNSANPPVRTDGYSYDAFGAPTHTLGASANNFQFTGQQRDPNSGLYYLRARYYDSTVGRFLTRDSVPGQPASPQRWDQYVYALNNPTSRVDPTGMHDSESVLPCISFALFLASFAALAITSPIAGLYVSLALVLAAGTIDEYAHDNTGAAIDLATFLVYFRAGLTRSFGGDLLRATFVLNLIHDGPACHKYLTS